VVLNGILVDDAGHDRDLATKNRDVFQIPRSLGRVIVY
jgi:hypothetical protein